MNNAILEIEIGSDDDHTVGTAVKYKVTADHSLGYRFKLFRNGIQLPRAGASFTSLGAATEMLWADYRAQSPLGGISHEQIKALI